MTSTKKPLGRVGPGIGHSLEAGAVDKSSGGVRAMFSAIAGRYDLLNHLLSCNQDRRWRRRAVRLLSPRRGERVLDLCCGTGALARECLRQSPRCEVVGLDFALPMLQIAAAKPPVAGPRAAHSKSNGANRATSTHPPRLLAGDALRQPFGDACFDAVAVAFGARNFENTGVGLREMRRIVKPGGRVLVVEFTRATSPLLRRGFGLFFRHALPAIGRAVSRHDSAYSYLPASVEGFYTRREFEGLLRAAGFVGVRSFNYSGGIATSFIARRPAA